MAEIKIDYGAVYMKTAQLMTKIYTRLGQLEGEFAQVVNALQMMDGSTNAASVELVNRKKAKYKAMGEVMCALLLTIDQAAQQVHMQELMMISMFSATAPPPSNSGGQGFPDAQLNTIE